jgi:hypothetical protein
MNDVRYQSLGEIPITISFHVHKLVGFICVLLAHSAAVNTNSGLKMDFQTLLLVATARLVFLAGKYASFNRKDLGGSNVSLHISLRLIYLLYASVD